MCELRPWPTCRMPRRRDWHSAPIARRVRSDRMPRIEPQLMQPLGRQQEAMISDTSGRRGRISIETLGLGHIQAARCRRLITTGFRTELDQKAAHSIT